MNGFGVSLMRDERCPLDAGIADDDDQRSEIGFVYVLPSAELCFVCPGT
jgi:hypothetical protein